MALSNIPETWLPDGDVRGMRIGSYAKDPRSGFSGIRLEA